MLFSKIYKISRDLRGKIPNFFYSAEAVGAVSVTHKSGPVRRGRRGVILSAVRCAYVFMFCSYFFLCVLAPRSLCSCSVLFFLLLIFLFGFFSFFFVCYSDFSMLVFGLLRCRVFRGFAVVAVAARLNVFMARISANMQSDHNLLNVFFAQDERTSRSKKKRRALWMK